MIKKISIDQLEAGMFVNDFNHDWKNPCCQDKDPNAFRGARFIQTDDEVRAIINHGITELYIDSEKGKDVESAQSAQDIEASLEAQMRALDDDFEDEPKPVREVHFNDEVKQASQAKDQARKLVGNILVDSRLGKQVTLAPVKDAVTQMAESMFRNPDAILSLSLIKKRDEYTFMHSVNVGVFLMSFCRAMEMKEEEIINVGIGGMLHDIGKMHTPEEVLNKKGKLTDEEFAIMQEHVVFSRKILEDTPGIEDISIKVAAQHHERFDGTGYPMGLKGDDINFFGQMAAIVDVYDAITSDRCYHKGNPPNLALKRMLDWSKHHFNMELFQKFIQCVGIYPMGTLVRLKNNLVGVVLRPNKESLLHPVIKIVLNAKTKKLVQPKELNLLAFKDAKQDKKTEGFAIAGAESSEKWKINPAKYMTEPQLYKDSN
ncbi:MAG: HD-GYP domain-containing protein [Magnetococcales bacterium]|nr:HD-GYP domain-containing protein [Magnetococcales bacterium]